MTGEELRRRINLLGLTYANAAWQMGLSLSGLNHQMRGVRPVTRQTARLIELIERLEREHHMGAEGAPRRRTGS